MFVFRHGFKCIHDGLGGFPELRVLRFGFLQHILIQIAELLLLVLEVLNGLLAQVWAIIIEDLNAPKIIDDVSIIVATAMLYGFIGTPCQIFSSNARQKRPTPGHAFEVFTRPKQIAVGDSRQQHGKNGQITRFALGQPQSRKQLPSLRNTIIKPVRAAINPFRDSSNAVYTGRNA